MDFVRRLKQLVENVGPLAKVLQGPKASAPATPPAPVPKAEARDYTTSELRAFDGSDATKPILLAIRGTIYDVTRSRAFYGPDGPYGVFAGNECARALAMMSTDLADVNGNEEGLGAFELDQLEGWAQSFEAKYPVIGKLLPDN
jgi:membrane-associated progesterone receptor component